MCDISENLINIGKAEIITKMLYNGMSYEKVSQIVGLSIEDVKCLANLLS